MVENLDRLQNSNRYRKLNFKEVQTFFNLIDLKFLLKTGFFSKQKTILDIGCGFGFIPFEFKQRYNVKAYGVDIINPLNDIFIDGENSKLKKKAETIIKNINFIEKDILSLKVSDVNNNKFDFIYSFRTFMYLKYDTRLELVKNLYDNFLKIGGTMLIDLSGSSSKNNLTEQDLFEDYSIFKDSNGEFFDGFSVKEVSFMNDFKVSFVSNILIIKKKRKNLFSFKVGGNKK